MSGLAVRARRIDLRLVDPIFAAVLALDLVLESALAHGVPASGRIPSALFAVPFAATIAVRRRWPAGALIVCTAIALLQQLLSGQLFTTLPSESAEFAPILCAYGAGAWLTMRRGLTSAPVAIALFMGMAVVSRDVSHSSGAPGWGGGLALSVLFIVVPWAIGRFARERGRRAAAFTALEDQAIAERAERERTAIARERILIGRELQDIIAHNVSVMVVQAGGARRQLSREPERARESILAVEQTGREALAEMRRLLGLLRKDDDPRALSPQPGLDQLPELAGSLRDAGLRCELREEGEPIELTPGVNLVGYRVVEAVLTGVGDDGCTAATTTVRYGPRGLELEVNGVGVAFSLRRSLRSVSERVELYGGELEVIERDHTSGFTVRCRLPFERARAA